MRDETFIGLLAKGTGLGAAFADPSLVILFTSRPANTRSRFMRVTPLDVADLRAKGLCFHCRKSYALGHERPLKQLRVMLADEDEFVDMSLPESEDQLEGGYSLQESMEE